MHILLIKLSSLGDLIHTLPAVTDALAAQNIKIDWVVEDSFAEIPPWQGVHRVIPIALRKWHTGKFATLKNIIYLYKELRSIEYDVVIDLQGLLKSALIGRCARAKKYFGFAKHCVREPMASYFYSHKIHVPHNTHVITKLRLAMAQALGYTMPKTLPNYVLTSILPSHEKEKYILLLHGTTWENKHWPEPYWEELIKIITANGFLVKMTFGNAKQKDRVIRLQKKVPQLIMLSQLTINQAAAIINNAVGAVSVDTGFGHLAVALGKPTVMLFGPSNSKLVGPSKGALVSNLLCVPCNKKKCCLKQDGLQPPCLASITPQEVWMELKNKITKDN